MPGHEHALAGLGGRGDQVGRAARHAAEVARARQRDEDHPLAEVAPQREPVDVTADVVDVGQRAVHHLLEREAAGVRRGGPQREAHRGWKAGHAPIVGVATDRGPGRGLGSVPMSDVLEFAGVSVVRGGNTLLDDITWEVEEGERWVILGPNGAGKTTLLQLAAGRMHPTTGVAGVLGEVLGAVDVFELRPRIGLASASIAERLPAGERVRDVVVTASYGIVGPLARAVRRPRPRPRRRAAGRARARGTWPSAPSARSARASASGCRSPGR